MEYAQRGVSMGSRNLTMKGAKFNPGNQLKRLRNRLGITIRQVETYSRRIAQMKGNKSFVISDTWLTHVENKGFTPSIYKLFSLSVIYRKRFADLLALYGIDLKKIGEFPEQRGSSSKR